MDACLSGGPRGWGERRPPHPGAAGGVYWPDVCGAARPGVCLPQGSGRVSAWADFGGARWWCLILFLFFFYFFFVLFCRLFLSQLPLSFVFFFFILFFFSFFLFFLFVFSFRICFLPSYFSCSYSFFSSFSLSFYFSPFSAFSSISSFSISTLPSFPASPSLYFLINKRKNTNTTKNK